MQTILESDEIDRYEFAATKNFEYIFVDENKYEKKDIEDYIAYYNNNHYNSIGKFEEVDDDIVYKHVLFSNSFSYIVYTNWVALDTRMIRMYKWIVRILYKGSEN